MKDRKSFPGVGNHWEGGSHKERVNEGEYDGYILYLSIKIE
jgi:hypothetical protein